jgi:hypothetical protein
MRPQLARIVATIDFVLGFFLLFGGLNLAVHKTLVSSSINEITGIISMAIGLILFLSASRIVRGQMPRFRLFAYLAACGGIVVLLLYQYFGTQNTVSRKDAMISGLSVAVLIACGILQVALGQRPKGKLGHGMAVAAKDGNPRAPD